MYWFNICQSDHKNPNKRFSLYSELYLSPHLTLICSAVGSSLDVNGWESQLLSSALWEQCTHMFMGCQGHIMHKAHSLTIKCYFFTLEFAFLSVYTRLWLHAIVSDSRVMMSLWKFAICFILLNARLMKLCLKLPRLIFLPLLWPSLHISVVSFNLNVAF